MFNSRDPQIRPGSTRVADHLRTVEIDVVFRRLHCYKCDLTAVYKYRVKQIRRQPELIPPGGGSNDQPAPSQGMPAGAEGLPTAVTEASAELSEFDLELWKTIPRFAEIPETVRCKRCGEVLGLCTECIF
ncbi:MAG: hypothetical protein Kow001_18480 [Acidobacteriota bacterium]